MSHMTPMPAYLSPEEFVSGCLAGLASVIARMDPADQARANAAMDVHAAARLLGGPVTAEAAHAAEDRLRTLLVELLPAAEAARFVAMATGADSEPAPVGGPLRIEIELPNGGSTLTLDQVGQILVAAVVNLAAIRPGLQLRSAVGRDAAGRLLLAVTADGRADGAPDAAPDILSQAQEIARAAWAVWTAPGDRHGGDA